MVKVITNHPVAYESLDHIEPKGTANDNTKNGAFVRELIRRFGLGSRYMDLGCAGGGFVSQFINSVGDEGFAVGIEGSDYGLKNQTGEWSKIPGNLFTADITKPFRVEDDNGNLIKFHAISAYDVLEHISEEDLPQLLKNVSDHLTDDGIFITGIATFPDEGYHVTIHEAEWWEEFMNKHGLVLTSPIENFGRMTSINAVWVKLILED